MTEELTNGNAPALIECGECGQGRFKDDSAFALCDLHGLTVDDVKAYPGPKAKWKYQTDVIEKAGEKYEKRLEGPKNEE